jgi:hypothetical protein
VKLYPAGFSRFDIARLRQAAVAHVDHLATTSAPSSFCLMATLVVARLRDAMPLRPPTHQDVNRSRSCAARGCIPEPPVLDTPSNTFVFPLSGLWEVRDTKHPQSQRCTAGVAARATYYSTRGRCPWLGPLG